MNSAAALPPLERRLMAAFGRFTGGLLLAVVAAAWLAVMTWSLNDPSLTHATSGTPRNVMGPLGAIVSDLLLQTLGLATLVVLIVPLFWGLAMAKASGSKAGLTKPQLFWFPVAVIAAAGVFSALPVMASWPLHHALGGIVGDTVYAACAKLFQLINTTRGGIAAGLLLALLAGTAMGRATGVAWADLLAAAMPGKARSRVSGAAQMQAMATSEELVQPYTDPAGRIEPELTVPPQSFGGARVHGLASDASAPPTQGYVSNETPTAQPLGLRLAGVMAGARGAAQRGVAAVHHQARRFGASLQGVGANNGYGQGELDQAGWQPAHGQVMRADGYRQDQWSAHPQSPGHGYPTASHGPAHEQLAQQHDGHAAFPYADAEFDVTTEESSRSIAKRFAPPGAAASMVYNAQVAFSSAPLAAAPGPAAMDQPVPTVAQVSDAPQVAPQYANGHTVETPIAGARVMPPQGRDPSLAAESAGVASRSGRRNALLGGVMFRGQAQAGTKLPSINLLKKPVPNKAGPEFTQTMLRGNARLLEDVLADFGVKGEIRDIRPGPVVTLFEFEPARGVKSSRVIGLAEDIARSMSAVSARVAVVPGRNAIGIELPNTRRDPVLLREVLESDAYKSHDTALPIALGKSIGGESVVADLARMPHLLVAGTTGSGKSVGVNAMIMSLLYRLSPDECRFIMIDPKMLELSVYNGIPHLLAPVVTDPSKAVTALNWVVGEMEERYKRMSKLSVRNIDVYNNRVRNAKKRGEMISR
ncbi:MAG TPA: DNA translocase FtsK 4TM domain-containing protein, partial [Hyphomicrobiaceae bacterium]|nr:DNA translocase FtsK 4TM domain-containing protein [Hyphomicrobiaceae bacterium]